MIFNERDGGLSGVSYYRPREMQDALAWLHENRDAGPVIAAGCTDLFPATQSARLKGEILDITAIEDLRGISRGQEFWRFGTATTWTDVVRADLPQSFDALKQAAREVGSIQIQNTGTLGGNLCNASPAADGVPCWLVLDAKVELVSASGARQLSMSEFILGPRQTALEPGEVLSAVLVPTASAVGQSDFSKLGARKYLVISIATVAGRIAVHDGRIDHIALAVGSCSGVATRLDAAEAALRGRELNAETAGQVKANDISASLSPIDDVRGDRTYRHHAAVTLVRRAICTLAEQSTA